MEIGCEVFHNLKSVIKKKFGGDATLIGDEGGFAPPCDVESGLEMIMEAADKAGYLDKVSVGLDVAASEFKVKDKNEYDLDFKSSSPDPKLLLTGDELIAFYKEVRSTTAANYIARTCISNSKRCSTPRLSLVADDLQVPH